MLIWPSGCPFLFPPSPWEATKPLLLQNTNRHTANEAVFSSSSLVQLFCCLLPPIPYLCQCCWAEMHKTRELGSRWGRKTKNLLSTTPPAALEPPCPSGRGLGFSAIHHVRAMLCREALLSVHCFQKPSPFAGHLCSIQGREDAASSVEGNGVVPFWGASKPCQAVESN